MPIGDTCVEDSEAILQWKAYALHTQHIIQIYICTNTCICTMIHPVVMVTAENISHIQQKEGLAG